MSFLIAFLPPTPFITKTQDAVAQTNACKVLFMAAATAESAQLAIGHAGGIEACVDSMKEYEDDDKTIPKNLNQAFDRWYLEAAVLSGKVERRAIYRALTEEEIGKLKSSVG